MSTNDKNIILELSNKKYFFEDEIAYDSCFDYFIQTGNYKEKDIFVYKTSDERKINYLKKLVEDEERKRKKMDIDDCWEDSTAILMTQNIIFYLNIHLSLMKKSLYLTNLL